MGGRMVARMDLFEHFAADFLGADCFIPEKVAHKGRINARCY